MGLVYYATNVHENVLSFLSLCAQLEMHLVPMHHFVQTQPRLFSPPLFAHGVSST